MFTVLQGFNVAAPVVQRTVIRSAARLTYESAQRLIDRTDTADINSLYLPKPEHVDGVRDALVALQTMSKMMQRQREVCGGGKDSANDDVQGPKYESNDMVEEWMIRCNSTIASIMCARPLAEHYDRFTQFVPVTQRPHACPIVIVSAQCAREGRGGLCEAVIYCATFSVTHALQVNEGPREFKMNALRDCMVECKRPNLVPHHDTKSYLDAWLEQLKQHFSPDRLVAVKKFLALNAPKQYLCATASVPDSALLHWSLGLRHYTSFTSPMRKYVDLTVHRQVLGMLDRNRALVSGVAGAAVVSKRERALFDKDEECFTNRARLLNAHEANHAAFKKAVTNLFIILSGQSAGFTVSVDLDRSKVSVAAEIHSLRLYRGDILIVKAGHGQPDDRITCFAAAVDKKRTKCVRKQNGRNLVFSHALQDCM